MQKYFSLGLTGILYCAVTRHRFFACENKQYNVLHPLQLIFFIRLRTRPLFIREYILKSVHREAAGVCCSFLM